MTHSRPAGAAAPARRLPLRQILVGVVVIAALLLLGRRAAALLPAFSARVAALGAWGPIVFVVGYVVAAVAFVPGSLLTLAAGAIFGLGWGVLLVFVGATLGAAAAFLIARYVARGAIERRVAGDARFARLNAAIAADGRRIVFLLRLSPVFPFNLLNYGLGLTTVRFVDYLIASVGMLPGTVLYVYYGKLAGDVATLAGGVSPPRDAAYYAVLGIGLAATVLVTTLVTRTARRALAEATDAT